MQRDHSDIFMICHGPNCDNKIWISSYWIPGGINDKGGFVIECDQCKTKFACYGVKDVNDSEVSSGGKLLARWDDDLGNKDQVLREYGLST